MGVTLRFVLFVLILAWAARAEAQLKAIGTYRVKDVRERCISFSQVRIGASEKEHDAARCRVSNFAAFATVDGKVYYRALYCLTPHWYAKEEHGGCTQYGARAVAIFVADKASETAMLLLERTSPEIGVLVYGEPEVVTNEYGTILHVKIAVDGTGVGNESEYYLLRDEAWHLIDSHGWLKALQSRVPRGLEIWKGIWPDLKTMTARIALYRRGDANCCPTGGAMHVTLRVEDNALVITSVRYVASENQGGPGAQ